MKGWQAELLAVASLTLVVIVGGVLVDALLPALLLLVTGYLGWHLLQLARFHRQARRAEITRETPPGAWGDIWRDAFGLQAAEHKIRKKLARFDARFRDAAATFPDALVALSRSHNVRWCNAMAADLLFDKPADSVVGKKIEQGVDSQRLAAYLQESDYSRPLIINPPGDRSRVLRIRMLPFGRKKHQLLLIASDITRTHHLDAARRDFVANVSHELRTPLTVITGYLEPLAEQLQDEADWTHSIQLMQEQAVRMQQMIDDLTLLSRLESEEKLQGEEQLDIQELLIEVVRETRALKLSHEHDLDVATDAHLHLVANRAEIRSVISNLLINAIRHTPAGTRITIRWQRTEHGAAFEVSDDGPGIPEEHIPRLTERFYRVDPGRARRSGGTGLGLAIVKHVLSRHGAQLAIDSEPGQGSRFVCEFPAHRLVITRPLKASQSRN
ncbi:MAG: phosphate regulon sensor histidine kinase PhoR [Gammaproteobacteria bacterium]|nr:phosphate regulon sensor histidine kinase PhoR [Gammaproteobacteria bacterium]